MQSAALPPLRVVACFSRLGPSLQSLAARPEDCKQAGCGCLLKPRPSRSGQRPQRATARGGDCVRIPYIYGLPLAAPHG
jgi:hypothetical protein